MQTARAALIGIILMLLAVGLLDGALPRQAIQILPMMLALRLMSRSPGYLGAYAAVSLSAFWMLVMVAVWLTILEWSPLVPGAYPPIKVALSVLIGLLAWVGFSRGRRAGRPLQRSYRVATLSVFAILQIAAVAVSFMWGSADTFGF